MTLRSIADIGAVIRNGVVFDFKNWTSTAMNETDLIPLVRRLFTTLEERSVDYVLVGGIALLHYVEGRNTQDIDLLMAAPSLDALPELDIVSQDTNFVRATYGALQVDVVLTQNRLFQTVFREHSRPQSFLDQEISIATVKGLLLLKLYALPSLYRHGNFARVGLYENDIATLLHAYDIAVEPLVAELGKHLTETDLMEVRNILADIQRRLARFDHGSADEGPGP